MLRKIAMFVGAILAATWGVSHLFPTSSVVKGFGSITNDNIQIITMEWINEGFTLIFIGLLVAIVLAIGDITSKTAKAVLVLAFVMLIAMSILSLFTGFQVNFLPFKLCPLVFAISGLLIIQGAFIKGK